MLQPHRVSAQVGDKTISIQTGKLAKQATGSVTVHCGDTIVLVTAVANPTPKEGIDFLPLTVDYQEKTFAAGKIPGGFFKREGKPSEKEVLTSRFIDRPVRPLFPENYFCETQIVATVLSADPENDPDILAIIGASAALTISGLPFAGPIAGCRIGRVNGQWVFNASRETMSTSDIDLIMVGSQDALVMVEGGANEVAEADIVQALKTAHDAVKPLIQIQKELAQLVGKPRWEVAAAATNQVLWDEVSKTVSASLDKAIRIPEKQKRYETFAQIKAELVAQYETEELSEKIPHVQSIYESLKSQKVRAMAVQDHVRIDGRKLDEIRPISCEVGILPRVHGSALFTRGETQALVATTLGTEDDVQTIDSLMESGEKKFMLHYNFPAFSVGEARPMRGPGRREIGHGALAERAVRKVMPPQASSPYTVRIVSEILESNGSSSMATVCGASLALMDAGVKTSAPVAGIAMGLIKEGDQVAILSDILGDEDHLGDMDFKVAGTEKGITAIQMDIKIEGLTHQLLSEALEQARRGRLHILDKMKSALIEPRGDVSQYAPRFEVLNIAKDKIREVIGPQGKVIKGIIEKTGVKIDINDDGIVNIFSTDPVGLEQAKAMVNYIASKPEEGKVYLGKVQRIADFGAFVEILPGLDGLLHISQIDQKRVERVSDFLKEGDEVVVKVLEVGKDGKVRLSRKDAIGLEPDVRPVKL